MSPKVNSQAVLKNLPPAQQEELYARLTTPTPEWPDTSLVAVSQWLARNDLQVSIPTLSRFRSWYAAKLELQALSDLVENFEEFVRSRNPGWTAAKVREACVQFFMAHAAAKRDVGQFVSVARLDQQERFGQTRIALDERKLKLSEKKLKLRERQTKPTKRPAKGSPQRLAPAEKEAEYRRIFGLGR